MFVRATLKSFHRNNPKAFRVSDEGLEETEISSLNEFLAVALDNELAEDFGDVPDFKVS